MRHLKFILLMSLITTHVYADSTKARCDVYVNDEVKPHKVIACNFSQRQGYITINRDDGIVHDLAPVENAIGTFKDQNNEMVYRQSGLGTHGLIFRFPQQRVFVYWDSNFFDEE